MKKLVMFAAVAAMVCFTSCQKSAADYKAELDQLEQEYTEALMAGDAEKAESLEKKAVELTQEMIKKAMSDPEFAQEVQALGE